MDDGEKNELNETKKKAGLPGKKVWPFLFWTTSIKVSKNEGKVLLT